VDTGDEVSVGDSVGTGDGVSDADVDIVVNSDGKVGIGDSITITYKQAVVSGVLDERSCKVRELMKF
jgi:hypothetical protein